MSLFDRIGRVITSNLNDLVSKAEDPEKILEQAVVEMQENAVKMRKALALAIATQKKTERQYEKNQQQVATWQERAQLAISKGNETLAREALIKKKSFAEALNALEIQLQQQIDQQQTENERLQERNDTIALEVRELKSGHESIEERAREQMGMIKRGETFFMVVEPSVMSTKPSVNYENSQ